MECRFCGRKCIKDGCQTNGKQRYKCKGCNKKQQANYKYNAYHSNLNLNLTTYLKEGVSIRGISRILKISVTTVMKRILEISNSIESPVVIANAVYEVDEIKTFVGNKKNHIWIAYALERKTKSVVSFSVGPRTNKTLNKVVSKISNAKRIYTDRLRQYRTLIDKRIHKTSLYGTNHIERNNLTIRTHLKRLNRKTICFSRRIGMLYAVLKIYFWG